MISGICTQENLTSKNLKTGLTMYKIGVVGMGFVGNAVFNGFSLFYDTKGYDIDPKKTTHNIDEVLDSDFVFVCLPTPEGKDGTANIDSLHDFFSKIKDKKAIFILKSTVPIGTTSELEKKYSIRIVHSPEFLSARTAKIDFITSNRVIIGSNNVRDAITVGNLFDGRFKGINKVFTKPEESEFVKYFLNCFFATKITFFNEMKLLSNKLDLNWDNIMNGVLSDGRIEKMHTDVPGHDGKFGFGGACFPKDTMALSKIFEKEEIDSLVLNSVIKQNNKIRNGF
jgi:UDPglucose 6-dehydrogenase